MWIVLLTIHLVIGFFQKPFQYAGPLAPVKANEHSHSHEFSVDELFELLWRGDVQHEHSHAEDSSHSHAHHHDFQMGSILVGLLYPAFEFSYPDIGKDWRGFHLIGPKDPFRAEILRPPIRA